ncbi:fibronectin type III domain-containing protein [Chryseosolibacter indicus]|uniref:Fibronectin type-III domain-containing protein n=1 Tax=Chryseosolibacter indicus TaxID=2782351 RepID=A0ABS5VVF4_9BACT|nr:hypothetical protein [Chryseosolibacter indicus]MBT1705417.1 hypothetical protein [Chryseosolibacter indicus]
MSIKVKAQGKVVSVHEEIGVIARPSQDSIVLRWAPLTISNWLLGNQYGYMIERFTVVRKEKVVRPADRLQLTSMPMKPLPEDKWEQFIDNKYGMIAAQALYGEEFQLTIEQADVMQIVNKAKENEQRFSIALFCADMSPIIAKAQGLYISDKQIEKDVKYLYRISVFTPFDTIRGSVFIDTSEKYILPALKGVTAETKGNVVTLRWNQLDYAGYYTSYVIERSEDGAVFVPINDLPGVTLSNSRSGESKYQYAVDSLSFLGREFHYRVRGITPFGELGPISNIVSVKGNKQVSTNPFIKEAVSEDNKTVNIQWEFPEEQNDALHGFEIMRAPSDKGPYKRIHHDLVSPSSRFFKDLQPEQVNYYRVDAKTLDSRTISSMSYLAMLVDSIPPSAPEGLKGKIDDQGVVRIKWNQNTEGDIYGYRIYRSYYQSEEFAQVTTEPLRDTSYIDQVQLKSLNEKVHYRILAIDRNQNQSVLSAILSLSLPDKVPPMPPVWFPVLSEKEGVTLRWTPSGSTDVMKYEVYKRGTQGQWMRVGSRTSGTDSLYHFQDHTMTTSDVQYYTVIAIDEAGLESPPAPVVTGFKLPQPKPSVDVKAPLVDRENKKIVLKWNYNEKDVVAYRVYRKMNDGDMQLYKTVKVKEFVDQEISPGSSYGYQVVAVFVKGALSGMGKMVEVEF